MPKKPVGAVSDRDSRILPVDANPVATQTVRPGASPKNGAGDGGGGGAGVAGGRGERFAAARELARSGRHEFVGVEPVPRRAGELLARGYWRRRLKRSGFDAASGIV